ncbi:superoxide dismutase [Aspergillus lucknowensis]|uniref:Superoxide dismutase [Cu-Zn] n=1 Tax=Aspergillus lucknowensis TaxID=176173 RepID=A0ABR4LHL8_9EURO
MSGILAVANMTGSVSGLVVFSQATPDALVNVGGILGGLTAGLHGFHVHESPISNGDCATAGSHFNPFHMNHGGPAAEVRHVGDLGNIEANQEGYSFLNLQDSLIQLSGEQSILGLSVVIHADEDDLGLGGYPDSLTTGHSGDRIACGDIVIPDPEWFEQIW